MERMQNPFSREGAEEKGEQVKMWVCDFGCLLNILHLSVKATKANILQKCVKSLDQMSVVLFSTYLEYVKIKN